jgi:hypothetical protein
MVQRRRLDANQDLACRGNGILDVLVSEDFGTAVLVDADSLHDG